MRSLRRQPLERRIGGEARAHQGGPERRGKRRIVDEIAWMRHQDVRGKTAIDVDAEVARRRADVLVAAAAGRTVAATDPRIDRDRRAWRRRRGGLAGRLDRAGDLVAEGEWERATRAHVELLVFAELEIAVLHVQVRMAHAAAVDAHEDLRALRLRTVRDGLAQRGGVGGERLAAELGHGPILSRRRG